MTASEYQTDDLTQKFIRGEITLNQLRAARGLLPADEPASEGLYVDDPDPMVHATLITLTSWLAVLCLVTTTLITPAIVIATWKALL